MRSPEGSLVTHDHPKAILNELRLRPSALILAHVHDKKHWPPQRDSDVGNHVWPASGFVAQIRACARSVE